MARLWKDNAGSTLAASINTTDTTLVVATGQGDRFPVVNSPDVAYVTLQNAIGSIEIVKITARTPGSDALTIVRAQEGTNALSWAAGDVIELRVTAGCHTEYDGKIAANEASIAAHIADTTDAHQASAIGYAGSTNLTATTVEGALDELDAEKASLAQADVAANTHAAAEAAIDDVDEFGFWNSATNLWAKITWLNLKAAVKTYLDTVHMALVAPGASGNILTSNGSAWGSVEPTIQTPAGSVIFYAASVPPAGYLKANGAAVSRTAYAALFAAIGTAFGVGDGSTTFNLPDLRGEFLRGLDDGRGVDVGRAIGSSQGQMFESHNHVITNQTGPAGTYYAGGYAAGLASIVGPVAFVSEYSGGNETRPRNIALLACIRY